MSTVAENPTSNPAVSDPYWKSRVAYKPPVLANLSLAPEAGGALAKGKSVRVKIAVQGIPTPLAKNPFCCRAASVEEAWQKFCEANGISGTDHPKTIELAGPQD